MVEEDISLSMGLLYEYSNQHVTKQEAATEVYNALQTERCRVKSARELQQTANDRIRTLEQEEKLLLSLRQNLLGLRGGGVFLDWSIDAETGCESSLTKIHRQLNIAKLARQAADLEIQDAQEAMQKAEERLHKIVEERGDLGAKVERLRRKVDLYYECKKKGIDQLQRRVSPEVLPEDYPVWPVGEEYSSRDSDFYD